MKSEIKSEKGTEMKNDYRSKAMFGVELQKRAQKWYLENPHKNKDGYADVVGVSRAVLYRAFKGDITEDTMEKISRNLNVSKEIMQKV